MIKLIFVLLVFAPLDLQAKRFTNQYTEFELPPGWQCTLEGTEWVCQSLNKDRKKEAIIILAAKIRGSQDSLDQYQAHLKNTKTLKLPGGKIQVSEHKYTKIKKVGQHRWVDSLHLASEVPGFYTRYLATVKQDLGVAVTFSVAKDHYASYQALFDKIVASLRVFRQKSVDRAQFKLKKEDEDLLGDAFIPSGLEKFGLDQSKKKKKAGATGPMALLPSLIVIAVLFFLFTRWKKKKKKK